MVTTTACQLVIREDTMPGQPTVSTSYEDVHEDMRLPMLDTKEKSDAPSPPPPDGIRASAEASTQPEVFICSPFLEHFQLLHTLHYTLMSPVYFTSGIFRGHAWC